MTLKIYTYSNFIVLKTSFFKKENPHFLLTG